MRITIILVIMLSMLNLISCGKGGSPRVDPTGPPPTETPPADSDPDSSNYTEMTKRLIDSTTIIASVLNDTSFYIARGVEETDIRYSNNEGKAMEIFILQIDLKDPLVNIEVATPDNKPAFSTQTVLDMAEKVDSDDNQVVGGINGDYFNTSTSVPVGILIKGGNIIKDDFSDNSSVPQQGLSFFGVLTDKEPYIGYKDDYPSYKHELVNATGGGEVLVMNHKIIQHPAYATRIDPRTAIGYTKDSLVYMLVADGRNPPYSNGMTYGDLSAAMKAFGVDAALTLDGGGSSTFITRSPVSGELEVRNQPSDGKPRPVSNAWIITVKK